MTDTTDIAALRSEAYGISRLFEAEQFIEKVIGLLEAERQRADDAHKYGSERDAENESLMLTVGRLRVEIAALKAKLDNSVVLPAGYSARAGHPFHEGERNVMIPNKHGDWLSRFDVEHAIHVAGFSSTVKGGE